MGLESSLGEGYYKSRMTKSAKFPIILSKNQCADPGEFDNNRLDIKVFK